MLTPLRIGLVVFAVSSSILLDRTPVLAQISRPQAQTVTVRIDRPNGEDGGSGVLVKREGNRYTVLTNCHVVQTPLYPISGTYHLEINGDRYPVSITTPWCHPDGIDLALIEFESNRDYTIPPQRSETDLEQILNDSNIVLAGFSNEVTEESSKLRQPRTFHYIPGSWRSSRLTENGYNLQHTAAALNGMSGGPIFDSAGRLVAIHGETVVITPEVTAFAAIPIHHYTSWQAQTPTAIITYQDAEAVTVRIDQVQSLAGGVVMVGSGVLVKQEGNEYTVLTNCHLLPPRNGTYILWINGNDRYSLSSGINENDRYSVSVDRSRVCHSRVDLAILTFTSTQRYSIATLRSERDIEVLVNEQTPITIAGFPGYEASQWRGSLLQTQEDPDGYELVHNVFTQPGMSGSPVFDAKGNLIAIHGRSLGNPDNKGFAIPIYYYTEWQDTTATRIRFYCSMYDNNPTVFVSIPERESFPWIIVGSALNSSSTQNRCSQIADNLNRNSNGVLYLVEGRFNNQQAICASVNPPRTVPTNCTGETVLILLSNNANVHEIIVEMNQGIGGIDRPTTFLD